MPARKMTTQQRRQYERGIEAGRAMRERNSEGTLRIRREQYATARYYPDAAKRLGVARGIGPCT